MAHVGAAPEAEPSAEAGVRDLGRAGAARTTLARRWAVPLERGCQSRWHCGAGRPAFGPDLQEDRQCPSSRWLCVLSSPHPERRGLWMLPLGKSLNVGMALKRGRKISFSWVLYKPVSFFPTKSVWAGTSGPVPAH